MTKKELEKNRLPISCPNEKCGEVGWIPIDRLDRQLVCRACGTRFYMESAGTKMMIGERPKEFVDPFFIPPPEHYRPNPIEKIEKAYRRLSKRTRTIAMGVLVAPLVIFGCSWVYTTFLQRGPKLPNDKDVSARSLYVARAFSNDKPEAIVAISDGASLDQVKTWMKKAKPMDWPRVIQMPRVTVRVMSQSAKAGKATSGVEIEDPAVATVVPPPPPAGGTEKGEPAAPVDPEGMAPPAPGEESATAPDEPGDPGAKAPAEPGQEATKAPTAPMASGADPGGDDTPPAAKEAEEPPPQPEKPKKLGITLSWVYRGEKWLLDMATTLKNTH